MTIFTFLGIGILIGIGIAIGIWIVVSFINGQGDSQGY